MAKSYRAITGRLFRHPFATSGITPLEIVPEGTHLKAGEQVLQLQSTEVQERLVTSRNLLNEKIKR
jgi:hypothetical protein